MLILGIETSCDETAAAVIKTSGDEKYPRFEILSNIVSSQVKLHAEFGGVIPNLAAREHAKNIIPVLKEALEQAKAERENIDLIAVTRGPGLIPALLIGTSAAKALAYGWQKPIIGVNHIEGHIYANCFARQSFGGGGADNINCFNFPALCLIVSGGHTELVLMRGHCGFELIGKTRDDAAGEAFDKTARLLDLGYPGGPAISKAAELGTAGIYSLPRPMIKSGDFDFSFSGIKTAVRELAASLPPSARGDIAAEFQQAVVDVLIFKTIKAAEKYRPKTIMLAGGVAANKALREQLQKAVESKLPDVEFRMPSAELCADNAAMIAAAGYFRRGEASDKPWEMETDANIIMSNPFRNVILFSQIEMSYLRLFC